MARLAVLSIVLLLQSALVSMQDPFATPNYYSSGYPGGGGGQRRPANGNLNNHFDYNQAHREHMQDFNQNAEMGDTANGCPALQLSFECSTKKGGFEVFNICQFYTPGPPCEVSTGLFNRYLTCEPCCTRSVSGVNACSEPPRQRPPRGAPAAGEDCPARMARGFECDASGNCNKWCCKGNVGAQGTPVCAAPSRPRPPARQPYPGTAPQPAGPPARQPYPGTAPQPATPPARQPYPGPAPQPAAGPPQYPRDCPGPVEGVDCNAADRCAGFCCKNAPGSRGTAQCAS